MEEDPNEKNKSGRKENCCMAYGIKPMCDSSTGRAGGICGRCPKRNRNGGDLRGNRKLTGNRKF